MKIVVILMGGMLVISGLVYGGLVYLNMEKQELQKQMAIADSTLFLNPEDSLKAQLEEYEALLRQKEFVADSLAQLVMQQDKEIKNKSESLVLLQEINSAQSEKIAKAKDMAKTFEKMDIKEISPILRNLDDEVVMLIYEATGNRFKKNILLALNEKRAAALAKQFIKEN